MWFLGSYLPTFLHDVTLFTLLFFWSLPLLFWLWTLDMLVETLVWMTSVNVYFWNLFIVKIDYFFFFWDEQIFSVCCALDKQVNFVHHSMKSKMGNLKMRFDRINKKLCHYYLNNEIVFISLIYCENFCYKKITLSSKIFHFIYWG